MIQDQDAKTVDAALSPWTRFMDMHSGGGQKLSHSFILIEAPEAEARVIFYNRFGRSPERVTCTCCGEDYSISEEPTLEQVTAYDRGCAFIYTDSDGTEYEPPGRSTWDNGKRCHVVDGREVRGSYVERGDPARSYKPYRTLDAYLASGEALAIRAADITADERLGEVPSEGYVWAE